MKDKPPLKLKASWRADIDLDRDQYLQVFSDGKIELGAQGHSDEALEFTIKDLEAILIAAKKALEQMPK